MLQVSRLLVEVLPLLLQLPRPPAGLTLDRIAFVDLGVASSALDVPQPDEARTFCPALSVL